MRRLLSICALVLGAASPVEAQPADRADAWLSALYDDVAADLAAGRPLVVQVHVPLCDNRIIPCGNPRLGDGDDPNRNLYWATSGGFRGWFGRKGSGWTEVHRTTNPEPDVLEVRVWRRELTPTGALRARKVRGKVPIYVVAYAWRGTAIARAMEAYARDLFGGAPRHLELAPGEKLAAGGAARLVAFVGHNGWMDVGELAWPTPPKNAARKGTIAIACITEDYLVPAVPSETRVPLLFTRSLLFAGAHALEGAVTLFGRGGDLTAIREGAVAAYAEGQARPLARVRAAFTNPSDRRWKHRR